MFPRILPALILVLLLAACSGGDGKAGKSMLQPSSSMEPGAGSAVAGSVEGFSLQVLDDAQLPAASCNFSISSTGDTDGIRLDVSAREAEDLKGLFLELSYDAGQWTPLAAAAGPLLDTGKTQLLQLADLHEPGRARLGQVLANWDEQPGISGSGIVASFRFSRGSFQVQRRPSQVAGSDAARARLEYNQFGNVQNLAWFYSNPGDYNQDGVVSISDLTPLGQNFGDGGPFAYSSAEAVVDGDGNDEINISDLTVIGQNLGNEVLEYALYWSSRPDLDIPDSNTEPVEITPTAILDGTEEFNPFSRRRYVWEVGPDIQFSPLNVMWVRPLDGAGNPGTPSNHKGEDNGDPAGQAPVVHLDISQLIGEAPMTISLDASGSYDPRGSGINTYSFFIDNDPLASYSTYQVTDDSFSVEITEPGSYMVSASALKGGFTSTTKPILVSVTDGGNRAPVAVATLPNIFSFVETPASYLIDFGDSYDPDGDPLEFELDLWSHTLGIPLERGNFEIGTVAGTQYELNIITPGSYGIDIRATDDKGLYDIDTISLEVLVDDGWSVPRVSLWPDSYEGTAPFEVNFDYSWSVPSPEFSVDKLEIDVSGKGNWQALDPEQSSYTYEYQFAALRMPRIRLTDSRGYSGYSDATVALQINAQPGIAPTAMLKAAQTSGLGQLNTNLDARDSFDQYGRIVKYEFDRGDGTGWIEDPDSDGWLPVTYLSGEYDAMVRVTDEEGLTDTATLHISVS